VPKTFELRDAAGPVAASAAPRQARRGRHFPCLIYAWFTEGFATRDLQDAKALLEELA